MQTLSLALACAFLLFGSSMAGSTEGSLPGVGTFSYNGSPIAVTAGRDIVMATRSAATE